MPSACAVKRFVALRALWLPPKHLNSCKLMRMRLDWAVLGVALGACASHGGQGEARGGESAASDQEKDSGKKTPDIGDMITLGPCVPKMRAAIEEHLLEGTGSGALQAFIMGIDERLCIVGSLDIPSPTSLKLSSDAVALSNAKDTLISVETRNTSKGSVMVIHNHHTKPLRYRAFIRPAGRSIQPTSVCPVRPNTFTVETWPYPIDVFSVGDFELLDENADMSCR
jgi:hypothetical protein